jgi:hypothetical protein
MEMSMTEPMTERHLLFVDTETTGLHPLAQAFELGWKKETDEGVNSLILPHSLFGADPAALKVNRYRERGLVPFAQLGREAERHLDRFRIDATDATLVIANPSFDVPHLMKLVGFQLWHYRIIDIESYAMPILGHSRPQGMSTIYRELTELGHQLPENDHTVVGDIRMMEAAFNILRTMGDAHRQAAAA